MPVITNNYLVDALLLGSTIRWNATQAVGTPVAPTYSFMLSLPSYTDAQTDGNNFSVMTDDQKTAVRSILASISEQFNISFTEVAETSSTWGQLRFGNNTQTTTVGYAYCPDSSLGENAGDLYINNSSSSQQTTNVVMGTNAYSTLIHEIGHTLGLKHPGNYNAGDNSSSANEGPYLTGAEDSELYSIMSYTTQTQGLERINLAPYDYAALAYLYGAKPVNTGNDVYSLSGSIGLAVQTIFDSGGTDTLDASTLTTAVRLDLNVAAPGTLSSAGQTSTGQLAASNLSLGLSTEIENAVGGSADDVLIGNALRNYLTGNAGNDSLDGGAGTDIAAYSGNRASFTVTQTSTGFAVTDNSGAIGTDTLTNIERLQFSDTNVALDVSGSNAGTTAKILGAVFGAASVSNKTYVGIGLNYLDGGMSYADLMALALNAAGATSSSTVVSLLWTNLFGAAPTDAEAAPYVAMLDSGSYTSGSLGVLAADTSFNTANINLTGLAQTGVEFI